jgi:hypothetical protein
VAGENCSVPGTGLQAAIAAASASDRAEEDQKSPSADPARAPASTAGDTNVRAMDAILQHWDQGSAYAQLSAAINANAPEAEEDSLDEFFGGGGLDWFLSS